MTDERGAPLTLGTAGHVDHGKTALVAALTGIDTDRLPEEKARGLSITLGYAPLSLPSGRRLSVVDVPGHERFVRTMVSGASGIDVFLMAIAADDGVMPQTTEHADVLRALGVHSGVVAVTKSDLADPSAASAQAAELLPGARRIACCVRTGAGLHELRAALESVAAGVASRAGLPGPARLHVDRCFTVAGRGTVLTGTLWSGAIRRGASLELHPGALAVRVRGVEVHDEQVEEARAGQRVAVNIVGAKGRRVVRGDVLAEPGALSESSVLDCELHLRDGRHGERVQVLHGTRAVAGRIASLDAHLWQLRLERPLLACDGDRLVVRRLAPPQTLGGGVVLEAAARRHGANAAVLDRLRRIGEGRESIDERPSSEDHEALTGAEARRRRGPVVGASAETLAQLEARLLAAGTGLLSEAQIDDPPALRALSECGRAVRVSGRLYAHADVLAATSARVVRLIEESGPATLAEVRDALGLSRKTAQAFLEHLDAARVTHRMPDDTRVLASRAVRSAEAVA